jgi:hypothetical protein
MTSGRPETSIGFFLERVVLGRDMSTSLAAVWGETAENRRYASIGARPAPEYGAGAPDWGGPETGRPSPIWGYDARNVGRVQRLRTAWGEHFLDTLRARLEKPNRARYLGNYRYFSYA